MTDVMERLAAANPAREGEQLPLDDVWRKIAADERAVAGGGRSRRRGGMALVMAVAAVPVIAVVLIAVGVRGGRHSSPHQAVTGGRHVMSTIQPAVQRSAQRALGARTGTVVVMNPSTGAIEAMAVAGGLRGGAHSPVPPGATFDVVTLATALSTGRYGPTSTVSGASPFGPAGSQVRNDGGQSFGRVTLSQALTYSVNTVFARVGAELGNSALARQMRLFELSSGPVGTGGGAVGRLAAGQGSVTATPLQLATIAAAIANGGRLAQPHTTDLPGARTARAVMPPRAARMLAQMLRGVVTEGTGTAADLRGLKIAGKTGTAPAGGGGHGTVVSFIGFAPADHPTVAIAVVLRAPRGGFGGTEAAPIAARVIQDVLRGHP